MSFRDFYESGPIINITEAIVASGLNLTPSGFVKGEDISKSAALFKNPAIATAALLSALSTFEKKYQRIKKYTVQLYASGPEDLNFYEMLVSDLIASGKYKLQANQFIKGGQLWALRRQTR